VTGPAGPAGSAPVRAVAIAGGCIAALGASAEEVRRSAPAGAEVLGFPGGFVRPGFWDTHIHIARTGAAARFGPMLYEARSIAEMVERLADFARRHPKLPAIVARAGCLDERVLAEGRLPAAEDLDRADPGRPVAVVDVNKCVLNSRAAEAAGALPEGPDWPVRVNRFLSQELMAQAPGGFAEDFRLGTEVLARRGVTCAVDGHTLAAQADAVRRLDADGLLGCRAIVHPATSWEGDLEDFQASGLSFGEELGPLSRVGPLKILYDLFVMHRTALMTRPYRGEPHNFGRRNIPPDGLRTRLAAARERGFPVAIHVTGDRGAAEAVEAFEAELARRVPAGSLLIHAYFPPEDLPDRMAALGMGLAAQPVFLRHWAETLERFVGWERIGDFNPLDDYLAAGVTVAAGSDAPICDFGPLAGIHAMVTRRSLSGREWGPAHAIPRKAALDLYAGSAARLFAWSHFPGSLEVGGPADFTVLDRDLATCRPEEIIGAKVLATYVAGRETYRAGAGGAD